MDGKKMNKIAIQIQKEFVKYALDMKKRSLPKDEDPFTYKTIADDLWWDLWSNAKKEFNTSFDLENNDSTKERRAFIFTRKEKDGFEHTYKFNCELWIAGGDWEYPCYYFKCQLVDGSLYEDDDGPRLPFPGPIGKFKQSHFILIPPKDGGNSRLVKTDKGGFTAPDNNEVNDKEVPELEPKKAWEWIQKYLQKLIEDYEKYWVKRRKAS